ncbi:MAG: hypothetical protein CH6_1613 [Candidatus Kapaibacterium sp.]|nr:MAG: hypothetical protein CH6_1613 [Candidatus Kapabacteria bacterium]
MEFSEDTKQVLEFLDYTSGGTLRKRNDLGIILETLATQNQPEIANELIFYGSALWGSYRIIKTQSDPSLTARVQAEIQNLFAKVLDLLSDIVSFFEEDDLVDRFNRIYLKSDEGAQLNLIDLCYDLNELKKVQIQLRNK